MRSTHDPIAGLKQKLLDWGVTDETELKGIDKDAREHVDAEVAAAEKMAAPDATPPVWVPTPGVCASASTSAYSRCAPA